MNTNTLFVQVFSQDSLTVRKIQNTGSFIFYNATTYRGRLTDSNSTMIINGFLCNSIIRYEQRSSTVTNKSFMLVPLHQKQSTCSTLQEQLNHSTASLHGPVKILSMYLSAIWPSVIQAEGLSIHKRCLEVTGSELVVNRRGIHRC